MKILEMAKYTAVQMAIRGVIGLWLASVFVCPASADSPPPASPAQLQALSNQIAGLQAQRQAQQKELAEWQSNLQQAQAQLAAAQAKLDSLLNPVNIGIKALTDKASGDPNAVAAGDTGIQILVWRARVNNWKNAVTAATERVAEFGQAIADLDSQIGQLQATLQDLQNPSQIQKALDDENAHKASLNNQQATGDDAGQLGWDKTNTDARIKELNDRLKAIGKLESDFQQLGPGGTSGASSGQGGSQGSYGSSPQTTGTTSSIVPGQIPWGYQPPESSVRIDHNQLQQSLPGDDKSKHSQSGSGHSSGCPG